LAFADAVDSFKHQVQEIKAGTASTAAATGEAKGMPAFTDLPDEVVTRVLSFLPFSKNKVAAQLVSKQWRDVLCHSLPTQHTHLHAIQIYVWLVTGGHGLVNAC
jgi:hypothetical protein